MREQGGSRQCEATDLQRETSIEAALLYVEKQYANYCFFIIIHSRGHQAR